MVTLTAGGQVEFSVYLPHAQSVEMIGTFTSWLEKPIGMKRCCLGKGSSAELDGAARLTFPTNIESAGWWRTELAIPEGDHQFSYLVDGRYWMPDYAATGIARDREGRWVSHLVVPSTVEVVGGSRLAGGVLTTGSGLGGNGTPVTRSAAGSIGVGVRDRVLPVVAFGLGDESIVA